MSVPDLATITKAAVLTIQRVQHEVNCYTALDPEGAFEEINIGHGGKQLLGIDLYAEMRARVQLYDLLGTEDLLVLGEESLRNEALDLSKQKKVVALLDMLDGSDLYERNLSNWCSAMVFYDPLQREILAAMVGLPNDGVYLATRDKAGAFRCSSEGLATQAPVKGPSTATTIRESSIAFYGQKIDAFLSVLGTPFQYYLESLRSECSSLQRGLKTRIYNLGGNPMAVRLISAATRIDAVFDLNGQAPHDIIPGAYIAQKAGASLSGLDGEPVDLSRLIERPAHRDSRLRYILAATPELSLEMQTYLKRTLPQQCGQVRAA
jgi:fructose-1,6-bisphosphatase/inositol monophosphatase family enzyme